MKEFALDYLHAAKYKHSKMENHIFHKLKLQITRNNCRSSKESIQMEDQSSWLQNKLQRQFQIHILSIEHWPVKDKQTCKMSVPSTVL